MHNDENLSLTALLVGGITGSGKGVPARWAEEKGYYKISTGDYFRKTHPDIIARGNLGPGEAADEFVEKHPMMGKENLVLDGYPRTLDQAVFAVDLLRRHKYRIFLISLRLDPEEAARRIVQRRTTSQEQRLDDQLPFDALVKKAEMQHELLSLALRHLGRMTDGRVCIDTQRCDQDGVRDRLDEFFQRVRLQRPVLARV